MPGVVGLITKMPRAMAERELDQMLRAVQHEPFYHHGTWVDEPLGIYVGWTALTGSFADTMPLERGHTILIFSGEEYGGASGSNGKRSSYLLDIAATNPDFPRPLNGLFHGLIVNRNDQTVSLFNDRFGMHRLYYHEAPDAFYFATEAKSILAARPDLRKASLRGLGEFLACSTVLQNRTIFERISVLPAASLWIFSRDTVKKTTYFEPGEWENQEPLDPESYYEGLRSALATSLPRYFAGPEPVGVALTGGMDTRVLLAQYRCEPDEVPCYTFGGPFRECQDVRLARKVAAMCGQQHHVIPVADDFLQNFRKYAERSVYLTEGTVDAYRSSDLYVSERARAIAPVKVVGTYGSEIVCRAVMFKPMPPAEDLLEPELNAQVERARDTYAEIRQGHPVTFAAFRQSPWYHHGILSLEQTQLTVRSPYLDNRFVQAVYRAPREQDSAVDPRLRLIEDGNQRLRQIRSDRGIGGTYRPLISMVAHAFMEFTFKAEYAWDYGMPQWLAPIDRLLSPLRPDRLFLGRHKFLHYRVWYRGPLAGYIREMLLDPLSLSRPYIQQEHLERVVSAHLSGRRNYTTTIHKLLTLELLQRLFFDPQ